MLWVTTRASLAGPLFAVPRSVATHPWFTATLFDAYAGFTTFYVWVAFKQTSACARISWFFAIMLLGNIAMSAYCLSELFGIPSGVRLQDLLTTRRTGPGWLGIGLTLLGIAVTIAGIPKN